MDKIISFAGVFIAFTVMAYLLYICVREVFFHKIDKPVIESKGSFSSVGITAAAGLVTLTMAAVIVMSYFGIKSESFGYLGGGHASEILKGSSLTGYISSPLYCIFLKLFVMFKAPLNLAGTFLSIACGVLSACCLNRIASILYDKETGEKAVLFLILSPFSVMMALPYHYSMILLGFLFAYLTSLTGSLPLKCFGICLAVLISPLSIILIPCFLLDDLKGNLIPSIIGGCFWAFEVLLMKTQMDITFFHFYKGLEGIKELLSPQASSNDFLWKNLPTLIFCIGVPIAVLLGRNVLSKGMKVYLIILAFVPIFIKDMYAVTVLFAFPLYFTFNMQKNTYGKLTLWGLVSCLTFCSHCLYGYF